MRVHYRGVRGNGSPHDIVGVGEVNDHDLILLVDFLPNTDEVVGLEGQGL